MSLSLQNDLNSIEVKIKAIEADLQRNHKTINMIKDAVRDIAKGDVDSLKKLQDALQVCTDGYSTHHAHCNTDGYRLSLALIYLRNMAT